jgi:dipeptidyl aminopeptidase
LQYIHRLSDHKTFPLQAPNHPAEIAYAQWSPTAHAIAYVYRNNLFVVPSKNLEQLDAAGDSPDVLQVTNDGSDTVFNGVPDWVYEEEVSLKLQFAFGNQYPDLGPVIGILKQLRVLVEPSK